LSCSPTLEAKPGSWPRSVIATGRDGAGDRHHRPPQRYAGQPEVDPGAPSGIPPERAAKRREPDRFQPHSTSIGTSHNPDEPQPPVDDGRLWDHYKSTVDEERFQLGLHWNRSQYFFVLNLALLAGGFSLLATSAHVPRSAPVAVFVVAGATAVLALLVNRTQRDYARGAREWKTRLEQELGFGKRPVSSGGDVDALHLRLDRIATFEVFTLMALLAADVTGLVVAVTRVVAGTPDDVSVAARVAADVRSGAVPLVISRDGHIKAKAILQPGKVILLRLRPGRYEASAIAGATVCDVHVSITTAPLQPLIVRCRR
jgi:hypothetical protein